MKIFVSYSRRDAGDFANQVDRHLSSFKYDIFTDVNDIRGGDIWSNTIEENISNCDIFVVIVTYGALQSPHVEREVLQAQREKKIILPCFHRGVINNDIKWGLEKIQGVEFDDKYELARNLHSKISIDKSGRKDIGGIFGATSKNIEEIKIADNDILQSSKENKDVMTFGAKSKIIKKLTIFIVPSILLVSILSLFFYTNLNQNNSGLDYKNNDLLNEKRTIVKQVNSNISIFNGASQSRSMHYDPSNLTINQGDKVTWTNNDDNMHTVTSGIPGEEGIGNLFDSGVIPPSYTFSHTFDKSGIFPYYCILHPTIRGQVVVA